MEILQNNITTVIRQSDTPLLEALDQKLNDLQIELLEKANSKEAYDEVSNEIFWFRELREKVRYDGVQRAGYLSRITELCDFLKVQAQELATIDEGPIRRLV